MKNVLGNNSKHHLLQLNSKNFWGLIIIFAFLIGEFTEGYAQTFTWETATDNGATVSETVSGITVTVSTGDAGGISVADVGGFGGSSGKMVYGTNTGLVSITLTFSTTVNILTVYAIESGGNPETWTYTPTGGTNSDVVDALTASEGHTVNLNWTGVTSFTVTTNISSNGDFGFDDIVLGVLPVELTSFSANVSEGKVKLKWETATEVNNYGFEVERTALQNINWLRIGFIQGHGNSNSPKEYFFIDNPKGDSDIKYRLKQIDTDGQYEYSPEVEVKLDAPSEFVVKQNFPNPFNPTTRIEFSIPSDNNVEIKIFNVLGTEVATLLNAHKQAGTYSIEFNASNFSSGIYFYKVVFGNHSELKKMILLR